MHRLYIEQDQYARHKILVVAEKNWTTCPMISVQNVYGIIYTAKVTQLLRNIYSCMFSDGVFFKLYQSWCLLYFILLVNTELLNCPVTEPMIYLWDNHNIFKSNKIYTYMDVLFLVKSYAIIKSHLGDGVSFKTLLFASLLQEVSISILLAVNK